MAGDNSTPAVHITFWEAEQYCLWAGKKFPTRSEWIKAGYIERAEPIRQTGLKGGEAIHIPPEIYRKEQIVYMNVAQKIVSKTKREISALYFIEGQVMHQLALPDRE